MKVYASLFEHINDGLVWLRQPNFPPRCIVKITNSQSNAAVFCEALELDDNFLTRYNADRRMNIEKPESSIVMSGWYRTRLGNLETKHDYPLEIEIADSWLSRIRASMQHPQNVVRMAIWFGLISVALGVIGLLLGALSLVPTTHLCR